MFRHLIFCLCLCSILFVNCQAKAHLNGITVLRSPFVVRNSEGELVGYFVDLLTLLSSVGNFTYTLDVIDVRNSGQFENNSTGLIYEQNRRNSDFAIGDFLTRIDTRYVDFTKPYFVSGVSVLVRRDLLTDNSNSIEKLLNQNAITIGTVRSGTVYKQLSQAKSKIGRQMYERLNQNSKNLVNNREEGIKRVLESPFALVQESINNELALDKNCRLTQLALDLNNEIEFEYAIAVQKAPRSSLNILNSAMTELKQNGKLAELKKKYWNQNCNVPNGSTKKHYNLIIISICAFFVYLLM